MESRTGQLQATFVGSTAVLMWATLALFTKMSGAMPPFQLTAMSFAIAFLIGVVWWLAKGNNILKYLRLPKEVWLLGVAGQFGYHFFYFIITRIYDRCQNWVSVVK